MKRIKALLYVDEEQLKKSTWDNESPVSVLVDQELGWCNQSGIFLQYVIDETIDINGNPIELGDEVIWYDPEEEMRDLSRKWIVRKIDDDIILITADEPYYSEAQVFPNELEIV